MDVKLRTGATVPEQLVGIVTSAIQRLQTQGGAIMGSIALYELAMLARDPNHTLDPAAAPAIQAAQLVEASGHMTQTVRDIVLAHVVGEGLNLRLVNPLAS